MKSAAGAEQYYYDKDPITGNEECRWYGKGAQELGLKGTVQRQDFRNLLLGLDQKGEELLSRAGKAEKRAAYDMTFSAPKSVSIAALHLADHKLVEAHRQAVNDALDLYEREFCHFRQTENGETLLKQSDNITTATFHHTTSRATALNPVPDPQLHSHAVTMNFTNTEQGWRAIRNDALFANQTLLLHEYKSKLAQYVQQAGYSVEFHRPGAWELSGFKQEWLDQFSKRSQEIEARYQELKAQVPGMSEAELKTAIAHENRLPKNADLTEDQLKAEWEAQVPGREIKAALKEQTPSPAVSFGDSRRLIERGIEACHSKESVFTQKEVFNYAYQFAKGQASYAELKEAFDHSRQTGEVIQMETQVSPHGFPTERFTSFDMLKTEQGIVESFRAGLGQVEPIAPGWERWRAEELSEGQQASVEALLTGESRFFLIQGDAGTGKTTAIRNVREYLQEQKSAVELRGLGFTGQAAKTLKESSGIETETLSRFLGQEAAARPQRVYIVDESSMISSKQFAELVERVELEGARAVFMGDGKQLAAIEAGQMFKDLQSLECCKSVKMEEVFRQTTEPMKELVSHVKAYQEGRNPEGIKEAFGLLEQEGALRIEPNREQRFQQIVQDYCDHEDLSRVALLTATNQDRRELNDLIRNELKSQGRIGQEETTVTARRPLNLSPVEKTLAASYAPGDRVFANSSLGAATDRSAGKELTILVADPSTNRLTLQGSVKPFEVDLEQEGHKLAAFEESERAFAEQDRIVFLKNDYKLDVQNGLIGTIQQIDGEKLSVQLDNGDPLEFRLDQYRYLDHAYCSTIHKAQGQTVDQVILAADSTAGEMNNTESLYVAVTRSREGATIYGNHQESLHEQFCQGEGKSSAFLGLAESESYDLNAAIEEVLDALEHSKEAPQVAPELPDLNLDAPSMEPEGPAWELNI